MHDIIIVGAGPAGLTAAIYARRANKTALVIEKSTFGGQTTYSPQIENYPGFISMSGGEFADKLVEQVISLGADIEMETVLSVRDNGDTKTVVTDKNEYEAKAVIIAVGVKHRQTGLENENSLVGRGISYCATCDGAFYRNKTVAVLGGGNSALQEAVLLSGLCSKVYVIQNLDYLTGEARLIQKVEGAENVEVITGTVITRFIGDDGLKGLVLKKTSDGSETELNIDGLFVAIGLEPDNARFSDVAKLDDYGYFASDETCLTET
ncbi:MAG: FAD-dependent oxidoreductase, partial [Clostridia bacterium]|nr:FAD-dependent oxidoreductase [Clostridia bacterium]